MKTYQDIEVGDAVKVRDRLTGEVSTGVVAFTPTNLLSSLLIRLPSDKIKEFDTVDVILPQESFPTHPEYETLSPGGEVRWSDNYGNVIDGILVRLPPSIKGGDIEVRRPDAQYSEMISAWRLMPIAPVAPDPLPAIGTLMESFEVAGGAGYTNTGSPPLSLDAQAAVQGASALRFGSAPALTGVDYYKTLATFDPTTLGATAFYVNLDDDYDWQCIGAVSMAMRLNGAGTIYNIATVQALANNATGRRWVTGVAPAQILAGGVGNHQLRFRSTPTSAKTGKLALDAAYRMVGQQARVVLSFDDVIDDAYFVAYPIMKPLGLVGVINVTPDWVGQPGKLTWDHLDELSDNGWGIQCDGALGSASITANPDGRAGAIAELVGIRDELVSRGFPEPKGFCYANGVSNDDGVVIEIAAATANGTTLITGIASTAGMVAGMRFIMAGASRTVRIAADGVAANSLTLTETIPALTSTAKVVDDSGEFHGNKFQIDALVEGFWFGRTTNAGKWFSQFGIAREQAIKLPGTSTTGMTFAAFQTAVLAGAAEACNLDFYSHFIGENLGGSNLKWNSLADFTNSMEWLAGLVTARTVVNTTYDKIYEWDSAASPPA